jgi:cytidylate kinase
MIRKKVPLIVITGHSGTGKTSLQHALAQRFDVDSLSGGGILRSVALSLIRNNKPVANTDVLFVKWLLETNAIFRDINNPDIKGETFAKHAMTLMSQKDVRELIHDYTTSLPFVGSEKEAVLLDMHVPYIRVWQAASLHIHLAAEREVCALRKFRDYISHGANTTFKATLEDISRRDFNDDRRDGVALDPFAIVVDTSRLDLKQVEEAAVKIVRERLFLKTV